MTILSYVYDDYEQLELSTQSALCAHDQVHDDPQISISSILRLVLKAVVLSVRFVPVYFRMQ